LRPKQLPHQQGTDDSNQWDRLARADGTGCGPLSPYFGELQRRGPINVAGRDDVGITEAGFEAIRADPSDEPQSAAEMFATWRDRLRAAAVRILDAVIDAYLGEVNRQEFAERTGPASSAAEPWAVERLIAAVVSCRARRDLLGRRRLRGPTPRVLHGTTDLLRLALPSQAVSTWLNRIKFIEILRGVSRLFLVVAGSSINGTSISWRWQSAWRCASKEWRRYQSWADNCVDW
jgi:hypothetical protein